ncbi:hypothetical protein SESBI_08987 [Sesbania bispinosa]|nr:hypothetical protein SESBI_08987 [Sesbania bispinosa]
MEMVRLAAAGDIIATEMGASRPDRGSAVTHQGIVQLARGEPSSGWRLACMARRRGSRRWPEGWLKGLLDDIQVGYGVVSQYD